MSPILLALALLGLVLHPICLITATCFQTSIHSNGRLSSPSSVFEYNPDETVYRVQLKDGPDSELDLSCKVNPKEIIESQNETIFLELYRKDNPFPFRWTSLDDVLSYGWWSSSEALKLYLNGSSGGLFFLCRSTASNGNTLIGMVQVESGLSPDRRGTPNPCTVYHGGQQWRLSNYEVLANPKEVKVAWVEVPSGREIPSSAFMTSLSLVDACNRNIGRVTDKRYIGRLVTRGGITQTILNFPEDFTEESGAKVGASLFGRHVKLNESSLRQVLVGAPSGEQLITGLVCKKTNKLLDLSSFREETRLTVKMRLEKGGDMVRPRIQTIFQKVDLPTGLDVYQTFICRYRCRGSNACPSRHVTVNRSTLIRTIDRTVGYIQFDTVFLYPKTGKQQTCMVAFGGVAYETVFFDKLTNPCAVKEGWTPGSGPFPNGTLAVINEVKGEKVFIGRIERPDGSFLIGQVAKNGIVAFVNEDGKAEEVIFNEKVSLLTVDA